MEGERFLKAGGGGGTVFRSEWGRIKVLNQLTSLSRVRNTTSSNENRTCPNDHTS